MIREDLQALFSAQADTAKALIAAYSRLLGGIPTQAGFVSLIENAVNTNYGAGAGVTFNQENIFINIFNSLVQGNPTAKDAFEKLIGSASTLSEQIEALYKVLVPADKQTAEGLAFLTRPEALAFYEAVARERGVAGDIGPAIVALSSLTDIVVDADIGVGDVINKVFEKVVDGTLELPAEGEEFTPTDKLIVDDPVTNPGGGSPQNNAPTAAADTGAATEDDPAPATGNVLANDTDAEGDILTVVAVNGIAGNVGTAVAGTYGTLTLQANGTWSYALDNTNPTVQALGLGDTLSETFAYTADDGTDQDTADLTITIVGIVDT